MSGDWLTNEIESTLREVFSSGKGPSKGPKGTRPEGRQGIDGQQFVPVLSLLLLAVTGASYLLGSWRTPPTVLTPALHHPIVAWVMGHQATLLGALIVAIALDVARYNAHRGRVALRRMVYQTTMQEARRVYVKWRLAPGPLTSGSVKIIRGSVIPEDRLAKLTAAINHAYGKSGRWEYSVRHDGRQDRLLVHRSRVVPDARSDRHRRLQAALDSINALPDAKVTVASTDLGGVETGYRITFTPNLKTAHDTYRLQVGESLVSIAGEHESGHLWDLQWRNDLGHVDLALKEPLPVRVDHPLITDPAEIKDGERLHVPYATGEAGQIAVWNISTSSAAPHMLVIGPTGGGKTTLILSVITELVRRDIPVIGVDPKKIELDGINGYPGVAAVIISPIRAAMFVRALCEEMHARMDYVRITKSEAKELPMLCAVLDEFFILSAAWQQLLKTGDKDTIELLKSLNPLGAIADLGALSRSSGIRLLVGIQRPDAQVFGANSGSVRDNFKTRASLSRLSQDGAFMMWGDAHVGRDVDASIPGRATVTRLDGDPMDAQVWWTPNLDRHPRKWGRMKPEDQALVDALTPDQGPQVACYSPAFRDFLEEEQRLAAQAETAPEPTFIGGRSLDAATTPADDLADALPARELTDGTQILLSHGMSKDLVPATVIAVTVNAATGATEVRARVDGQRHVVTERYGPHETVFLAAADLAAA